MKLLNYVVYLSIIISAPLDAVTSSKWAAASSRWCKWPPIEVCGEKRPPQHSRHLAVPTTEMFSVGRLLILVLDFRHK